MTIDGWIQIAFMLALVLGTARPLGLFMAAVFEGRRTFLDPAIRPIETRFYALSGVDEKREQTWLGYVMALLAFSTAGFVLLYAFLRLQYYLPLNPQGFSGLSEHLAFNTAISFVTAAIFASLLSFAAYNFFFINPVYTFTVAEPHELFALFVFLAIAVITSALAGRIREQAQLAVARMRATRRLYDFTRKLSSIASLDDIPEAAVAAIHSSLARPAVLLLGHVGNLELRAAWPPEDSLDTGAMSAALSSMEHNEPAGADTATLPSVSWYFLPLSTARGAFGVIGLGCDEEGNSLDPEARTVFETLAEQT